MMLQRSILRDKAVVDVLRTLLAAVNPVQGIVGKQSLIKKIHNVSDYIQNFDKTLMFCSFYS